MKITFSCGSCPAEFTVDGQLAGRSGRCKKCGARFVIPSADAVTAERQAPTAVSSSPGATERRPNTTVAENRTASGSDNQIRFRDPDNSPDRETSTIKLKPTSEEQPRLAQPKFAGGSPRKSSTQRAAGWLDAVHSQIALKPVSSAENFASARRANEIESDSISYIPSSSDLKQLRKKKKSAKDGLITRSYDTTFRKTAKVFRWINETAYGISILFMILALVGYVMQLTTDSGSGKGGRGVRSAATADASSFGTKALPLPNHRLITIGVSGIVILNLVRLAAGLANLIAIPFRKSPIEGIMFLIPPMTFLYIWQHWKRMEKPVGRIVGPTFALALVVAAYTAIAMIGKGRHPSGNILKEVDSAVKSIKKDVGSSVEQLQNNVESLQKQIPSQVDSAKKAIEKLQDRVQNATGDGPVPDKNDTDNQK